MRLRRAGRVVARPLNCGVRRHVKQTRTQRVSFGDEAHSGWLPGGAAVPRATPRIDVTLEIAIEQMDGGYILSWTPAAGESVESTPPFAGDLWFASLGEAQAAAGEHFGVRW